MLDVLRILSEKHGLTDVKLTLTDLYPNAEAARSINSQGDGKVSYRTTPLDATQVGRETPGLRTMVGSFHHMRPDNARKILEAAQKSGQPICIFELSDNGPPAFLLWLSLPFIFVMCLLITPMVRPMTWRQLVFTYLIPIIPLCFAWDGAVSNVRTYTLSDMDELLEGLGDERYRWEKGAIGGSLKKLYLLGIPAQGAGAGSQAPA